MATAIDDSIPCEHCNTQISIEEWSGHLRECINNQKLPTKNPEKNGTEDATTDGIPCEFCHALINLNDWDSHSKQCADTHKRGLDGESRTEVIPCEYCNEQISIHDWEWHSAQCAKNTKNNNTNELMEAFIPCEYCSDLVSIHDLTWHTKQCADNEKQRAENTIRRSGYDPNDNVIPCEYCNKPFTLQLIEDHQTECRRKKFAADFQSGVAGESGFGRIFAVPEHWSPSAYNLSRYTLEPDTKEYKEVEENFHKTLPNNPIVQIERIQNRRWYRQYEAHKDDFIERYGKSTEQWLFHGCKSESVEAIVNDCFNRSHAVRCAVGQGIYFATQAVISLAYTQPDANNLRHMFMARVLIGKTTTGNQSTRICPPGFDTTGGGTVFVTYHDAQAYGEYLITFR